MVRYPHNPINFAPVFKQPYIYLNYVNSCCRLLYNRLYSDRI
jgi:hypothetical protein